VISQREKNFRAMMQWRSGGDRQTVMMWVVLIIPMEIVHKVKLKNT